MVLCAMDGLSQSAVIQRRSGMLHYSLDVFDFSDVPITWDMKGNVQALLNEGINALHENQIEVAIGQLGEAIKNDPSLWIAHYYRGICYKVTDRPTEALHDFLEANAIVNDQLETILEIGKVYMVLREPWKAEKFLNMAKAKMPGKVEPYYFLGLLHSYQNHLDPARELFQTCEKLQLNFADSKFHLGLIRMREKKDPMEALPFLDKTIEADSMHADARQLRFLIRLNGNISLNKAMDDVNFLLTYNQHHLGWRMARAYLLIQYNDYEAAFLDIKRVSDASKMDQNNFLWRTDKPEESIDIQNAARYLTKTIYGLSDKNQLIIKKAFCQIVVGKYEESLATMKTSGQSESHPAFLYMKGLANELMGYWQEAQPFYNKALARDNDIFELHRKKGNVHARFQEWQEAEKEYNTMERLYPDFEITYRVRGIARFYLKNYMASIADLDRYLKTDSMNLECIAYRGRCYQEQGRMFPAMRDLSKGKEFNWIDFIRVNRTMDTLIWSGDSLRYAEFVSYFSVFRPFDARNIHVKAFELKVMMVEGKWSQIEREWADYGGNKILKEYKSFGSIVFTAYGSALAERNNLSEALRKLEDACAYDKSNAYAFYERGKLYLRLNELAKAQADFANALKLGDSRAARFISKGN